MKSFKIDTIFSNGQICDLFDLVEFKLQLDRTASARTRKINLSANQKGYDKSETTYKKLWARKTIFVTFNFHLFFKITSKTTPKQK